MITFILVVFFHVGPMGDGNSNATTNIAGFKTVAECQAAGVEVSSMTKGTVKKTEFVCVKQTQ